MADKENCSEGSRNSETAEQDSSELEREWEDEEEGEVSCSFVFVFGKRKLIKYAHFVKPLEVPSKTPAFIREKRVFSQPFVKNIQPRYIAPSLL